MKLSEVVVVLLLLLLRSRSVQCCSAIGPEVLGFLRHFHPSTAVTARDPEWPAGGAALSSLTVSLMDLVVVPPVLLFLHPDTNNNNNNNNKVSQEAFRDVWTFELQVVGRVSTI